MKVSLDNCSHKVGRFIHAFWRQNNTIEPENEA